MRNRTGVQNSRDPYSERGLRTERSYLRESWLRAAPSPPPPPPGTSSSPVRLHPTVTVEGVLEVVHASAHYTALAAAVAVGLSPLKVKPAAERKSKLPLPPLNPELQWVTGAASAALAS